MSDRCYVSPSPSVLAHIQNARTTLMQTASLSSLAASNQISSRLRLPRLDASRLGYNDGVFYPPSEDGLSLAAALPSVLHPAASPPSQGDRHVLVLLVDFPDVTEPVPASHFEELLFTGAGITLSSYYQEASGGLLRVTGEVIGWLRMPEPLTYYTDGRSGDAPYPNNGQRLVEDALDAAVAAGIDFAAFDQDGDGALDGLIVVQAGDGAEDELDDVRRPNLMWSHKWVITQPRTINGVSVYPYTVQPANGKVGVFCHEFGHFLGLPDLYDTTYRSAGVGVWCLMGAGSWLGGGNAPGGFSAWCRSRLGWVQPTKLRGANLHYRVTSGDIVHCSPRNAGPREYFLMETREQRGLDGQLPGSGLLVWHIDDAVNGNSNPKHYQVGLVQADHRQDLEFGVNNGDDGDPYEGTTGNQTFDAMSAPRSHTHLGKPSGVAATSIVYHAGGATADITSP